MNFQIVEDILQKMLFALSRVLPSGQLLGISSIRTNFITKKKYTYFKIYVNLFDVLNILLFCIPQYTRN